MIKLSIANQLIAGRIPYNKAVFDAILSNVMGRLEVLNKILLKKTYLVGERISVADIFIATSLTSAFTSLIDASLRAKIPNVVRYVNTIINTPKLASVFGKVEFIEKQPQFVAPAKEKKAKEPKPEQPKAEKKPKAPKAKEVDEEEEPLVPEEPKAKNPLDDLPKSSLNLETWKREYSNRDTRGKDGSLEWLYANWDNEGFSAWRVDFKYNDELTLPFMSANQVSLRLLRFPEHC